MSEQYRLRYCSAVASCDSVSDTRRSGGLVPADDDGPRTTLADAAVIFGVGLDGLDVGTEPGDVSDTPTPEPQHPHARLLANIKFALPELVELRGHMAEHVDAFVVYRFYHQSFKVFQGQYATEKIVAALRGLAVEGFEMDAWFENIVAAGTGRKFDMKTTNGNWEAETRPIVEAYLHVRWLLDEAIRCAEMDEDPRWLPEGWAALRTVFGMRYATG
jgi:hypothetical protein